MEQQLLTRERTKHRLWARLTRPERVTAVLLAVFAVRFLFSAAAQKLTFLRSLDAVGSGRPVDVWLLLLSCTAVLGTICLYSRVFRALALRFTRFQGAVLAVCCLGSAAFYLCRLWGRQVLYIWDSATYYNLQLRLESNFAESVFMGVGATVYKTWFNDYIPMVINLLTEPFFMFTDRTANTCVMLWAVLFPAAVYLGAAILLAVLERRFTPKAPRLFFALGMAGTLLFPLLHASLYAGMPDMLGAGFALVLLALGAEYDFTAPAPGRLTCMTVLTGMLLLTRRCYMSWVGSYFLLYGLWVLVKALRRRQWAALKRLLIFAGLSLLTVGGALAPMFVRMAAFDYAAHYSTYQAGGLAAELPNQLALLGGGTAVLLAAGVLYALLLRREAAAKGLALLAVLGTLLTVWLMTRVQSLGISQSLGMAAYYLLAFYLFALGISCLPAAVPRAAAAGAAAVFLACNALAALWAVPYIGIYGTCFLTELQPRTDMEQVLAVDRWLTEACAPGGSAYMINHGTTYSPEVFRAACLPDQSVRDILPYGACNPGNDKFPTEVFTADIVLTCTPFDPNNHTEKIDAVFRENLERFGAFEEAARFDMGTGYTILAYRRIKPVTRAEVDSYRAPLAEEDAQWPYNFSAVFDDFIAQNGL